MGDTTVGKVVLGCRRKLAESELERQADKQYSTRLSALVLSWTSLNDGLYLGVSQVKPLALHTHAKLGLVMMFTRATRNQIGTYSE